MRTKLTHIAFASLIVVILAGGCGASSDWTVSASSSRRAQASTAPPGDQGVSFSVIDDGSTETVMFYIQIPGGEVEDFYAFAWVGIDENPPYPMHFTTNGSDQDFRLATFSTYVDGFQTGGEITADIPQLDLEPGDRWDQTGEAFADLLAGAETMTVQLLNGEPSELEFDVRGLQRALVRSEFDLDSLALAQTD